MMADFYTVPELVVNELLRFKRLAKDSKILCPYDPQKILTDQLTGKGCQNVMGFSDESLVVDPIWWVLTTVVPVVVQPETSVTVAV